MRVCGAGVSGGTARWEFWQQNEVRDCGIGKQRLLMADDVWISLTVMR